MEERRSRILFTFIPAIFMMAAFLYITILIRPDFLFHHVQPPFILSGDFLAPYLRYPGGISEWLANLCMQSFYSRYLGPVVFFGIAFTIMWLVFKLMDSVYSSKSNLLWALVPFTLVITLANNYNLPFSVLISMIFALLPVLLLAKRGRNILSRLVIYTCGAVLIYYISGSGYLLLYSVLSILVAIDLKDWKSIFAPLYIAGVTWLIPMISLRFIFPAPVDHIYGTFYSNKPYFMAYEPSGTFFICLFSPAALLVIAHILARIRHGNLPLFAASALVLASTFFGHLENYNGDARKIVASDYYCYHDNVRKTARAAMSLKEYSFLANLNYNLAIGRAGRLSEDFFDFFQISGTDAVHPDVEFSLENSFIAADFYYDLGYISEARHWAYETLVNFPYSLRALQLLVKIHLVTGEYRAAERCLNILDKGLTGKSVVKEYLPLVKDTTLVRENEEIIEKRSLIPSEKELSPFIEVRFRELLEANKGNKLAYEYLMLYYLLDSRLEDFLELYRDSGRYFSRPVDIYEEALLMYGDMNELPVSQEFSITPATLSRFNDFKRTLEEYGGDKKMARNVLYWQMGKTYMYYLHFVFPRIIKPEIVMDEDDEPDI